MIIVYMFVAIEFENNKQLNDLKSFYENKIKILRNSFTTVALEDPTRYDSFKEDGQEYNNEGDSSNVIYTNEEYNMGSDGIVGEGDFDYNSDVMVNDENAGYNANNYNTTNTDT